MHWLGWNVYYDCGYRFGFDTCFIPSTKDELNGSSLASSLFKYGWLWKCNIEILGVIII
jgi:hypothetical protein